MPLHHLKEIMDLHLWIHQDQQTTKVQVAVEQVLLETEQRTMVQEVREDQEQPIQLQVHLSLTPEAAEVEFILQEDLEDQVDPVAEDLAAQEDLEEHPDQTDSAVAEAEVQTQLLVQDLAETE